MKCAIIPMQGRFLADLLRKGTRIETPDGRRIEIVEGLPEGAVIAGGGSDMQWDPLRQQFFLFVEARGLPEVRPGELPPSLVVTVKTDRVEPIEIEGKS